MELGEYLTKYRKEAGLTIDELASQSGVPKGTINKIIAGITKSPTLDSVSALASALGRTINDFDDRFAQKENAPNMTIAMSEDSEEDVIVFLGQLLTKRGFMKPGEKLSDSDYQFLTHLVGLLDTHFEQRRKG